MKLVIVAAIACIPMLALLWLVLKLLDDRAKLQRETAKLREYLDRAARQYRAYATRVDSEADSSLLAAPTIKGPPS